MRGRWCRRWQLVGRRGLAVVAVGVGRRCRDQAAAVGAVDAVVAAKLG